MVYDALIFTGLTLWNVATVAFFCWYAPARWDRVTLPGETPSAPNLIPYTEGAPDLRGLV